MGTIDIRKDLEDAFCDPAAERSGERLLELVRAIAARALDNNMRSEVVQVLREWLRSHREPETTLALRVVEESSITEALGDIGHLRSEVASGNALYPFYLEAIDRVMRAM